MVKVTYPRILQLPELLKAKSFFLFGPRSTGKSTLIAAQLPDAKVFDLLDGDVYEALLRRSKLLDEQTPASARIVVVDEIQRLPKLLNEVHRLIQARGLTFLLTGSSARKLKRGAANLLGGRAWEARLHPLVSSEIPDFNLIRYLNVGGLPHVYTSVQPAEELKSYVSLYLREEIVAEALVRKLDHFVRFLDTIALNNGEELHYQGLSNDSGVGARTIENHVRILEDTLVGFQVYPFLESKKRKAITRSKFYFFDLGVANRLAKRGEILEGSELFGKAFEHFIIRELKSYLSYRRLDDELCYWRTTSGFEVDAVIGRRLGVEIKAADLVTERHLRGLNALKEERLVGRLMVVSRDRERRAVNGIEIVPWHEFLSDLWSGRLLAFK